MDRMLSTSALATLVSSSLPFLIVASSSLLRYGAQRTKQLEEGDASPEGKTGRSLSTCSTSSSAASLLELECESVKADDQSPQPAAISSNELARLEPIQASIDGNAAVTMVAQTFSDLIFTVADSGLGLLEAGPADSSQRINIETRANAAEAIRGALSNGSLVSMVTSSHGVSQHLPDMVSIANDRTPCVFHIAAGVLAEDFSMHGDVGEVLSLRQSGFAFLASSTPQEAHDLALLAHLASIRASVPFVHFFDAHRISDEVSRISTVPPEELKKILATYKASLASIRRHRRTRSDVALVQSDSYFRPNDVALAAYRCVPDLLDQMMDELSTVFQRRYHLLEYTGAADATSVVIVMGSAGQVVEEYVKSVDSCSEKIGVLNVRLYRPWSTRHLLQALPETVRRIAVLDQGQDTSGIGGLLFMDVLASFSSPEASQLWTSASPRVIGGSYGGPNSVSFCPGMAKAVFDNLRSHAPVKAFIVGSMDENDSFGQALPASTKLDTVPAGVEQLLVWCRRHDGSVGALKNTVRDIVNETGAGVQVFFAYDADDQHENGEVVNAHVRFGLRSTESQYKIQRADTILCLEKELTEEFNVLDCLKPGGKFILKHAGASLEEVLPSHIKRQLARRSASLYTLDVDGLVADLEGTQESIISNRMVIQQIFLHIMAMRNTDVSSELSELTKGRDIEKIVARLPLFLKHHRVPSSWYNVVVTHSLVPVKLSQAHSANRGHVSGAAQMFSLQESEASLSSSKSRSLDDESDRGSNSSSCVTEFLDFKQLASWYKIFPEAFQSESRVHFDGTHNCKVKIHERLTPDDYPRNVFHMEVDISGTGLTYEMGDALSVYPQNNALEVADFINDMGYNSNEILQISVKSSDDEAPPRVEIVTVFQLLSQVLDVFGKPGKKFYKALLARANESANPEEVKKLQSIVDDTPDGKAIFTKNVDETVTFADLLKDFGSISIPVRDLLDIVPQIKPRLYSIASSSSMHPDSVHLLVVTEDWVTPSGKARKGLCSNFLADIWPIPHDTLHDDAEGNDTQFYVSCGIKPSMMKLPDDPLKPVIMAGTGTGMAPFRAFVQHRAFMKSQGVAVGPMVLYFGARYQAKEFFYGEELLGYHENGQGVLTHLRTAWSRDQEQKIYVQNRVAEDAGLITSYLLDQGGSFYLCGQAGAMPNDVQDAIVQGFSTVKGIGTDEASQLVSQLKEDGRFVLEVY